MQVNAVVVVAVVVKWTQSPSFYQGRLLQRGAWVYTSVNHCDSFWHTYTRALFMTYSISQLVSDLH